MVASPAIPSATVPGDKVPNKIEVRATIAADIGELESLYTQAFPTEDLLPLVRALLELSSDTLSLAAVDHTHIVGHIVLTFCHVDNDRRTVALLGPLGVTPERQQQGIGSKLIRAGFDLLRKANVCCVYVLGDPAYYARFGFTPEFNVKPPYALPEEWKGAWQSNALNPGAAALTGTLRPPEVWLQPKLWAP